MRIKILLAFGVLTLFKDFSKTFVEAKSLTNEFGNEIESLNNCSQDELPAGCVAEEGEKCEQEYQQRKF